MADFTLYYWPLPFRGQFIRAVLADAGAAWDEPDADAVSDIMSRDPAQQPVPFMAPPMLVDRSGVAVAQMPSILFHLADRFDLMPAEPQLAALTTKVVNDANDVLDEITLNGGQKMWTDDSWAEYRPRLQRWMAIWEETAHRHGSGDLLLGGDAPGLADLTTAVLWFTMADKLPVLDELLRDSAPMVHAMSHRLMEGPALRRMRQDTDARFGDAYCGGQIEKSLRAALKSG
ncbi:glutathione S-transferase [Paracoccus beibuensis]|uniref:glutathione S-transferase n=1 Tax=Paracoccus beibuensis TaxID=547602 RepID=UPI002240B564|nr:glutathione S-transferase [Paracoccus beibuensis]